MKRKYISIAPNNLKISINDFDKFITDSTVLYYELLSNYVKQLIYYENKLKLCNSKLREKAISSIIDGSTLNTILVKDMVSTLIPHTHPENILQKKVNKDYSRGANDTNSYLNDLKYLRRDWANTKEGEYEIYEIVKALKDSIEKYSQNKSTAVFLGAGMARIACEHITVFDKVYAIDKSYSMGYFFNKLLYEDSITFHEIHTSNVMNCSGSSKEHNARINDELKNKIKGKDNFEYIVGDAVDMPLGNSSIDLIASVYFTDVIALKLYMKEIVRVLTKGGLFIHFGPLDYFFSDILERLSAEEIVEIFMINGFEIVKNETIELPHLDSTLNMYKKIYRNWLFVAIKK